MRSFYRNPFFALTGMTFLMAAYFFWNAGLTHADPPLSNNAPARRYPLRPGPAILPAGTDPLVFMHMHPPHQWRLAAGKLIQDRQRTIRQLQDMLQPLLSVSEMDVTRNDIESVKAITSVLSKWHTVEAVPLLVEHLNYHSLAMGRPQTREQAYPCVSALVQIGWPALDPLLSKVKATGGSTLGVLDWYNHNAAYVLVRVLGQRLAVDYLQARIKQQHWPASRQRLKHLRHLILNGSWQR